MAAAIKQHMAAAGAPLWQQQQQHAQHGRSCSSSSCDIGRSCSGSSCGANCSMSSCYSSGSAMMKCSSSSRDVPYRAGSAGGGLAVAAVAAAAGITAGGAAGPAVWLQQQQQQHLSTASPFCSMVNQLQQLPGEACEPAFGLRFGFSRCASQVFKLLPASARNVRTLALVCSQWAAD
jgi:hypothetical protein